MLFKEPVEEGKRANFKNFSFNFDSAAGINYTVDVTKPAGEKITIQSMSDGTPFSMDKVYKVALNSYRGNGGGDLLTLGAGISKEDLAKRIIFATDKDLRYYLMQYIEQEKVLHPHASFVRQTPYAYHRTGYFYCSSEHYSYFGGRGSGRDDCIPSFVVCFGI